MEKIVITGMGAISALGLSVQENWGNLLNGVSGVGPNTAFDTSEYLAKIACQVKNFEPEKYMDPKEARRRDRYEHFATVATAEALKQSGLEISEKNSSRVGVVIATGIGGITSLEDAVFLIRDTNPRKVSPFLIPMLMPNGAAGLVAIDHGIHGPCFAVSSACASGADGIGTAMMMMRAGVVDAAIAGAAEATISRATVAAFDRIQAMSRRNDDYSMTPQPFDKNRDGLVIGEGAGILILETETHAKARGANILAEMAGYAATADAYHITAPHSEGAGGAQAIRNSLASAQVNPEDVGYISAHGTGTPLNDLSETKAIKAAFGAQAYKTPISSTKSMTGHMMGATGALEAIICVQAIREGKLPPTIHYQTPDPDCDLDYIPNTARDAKINVAMSNAFGFGGHNAVLVVRKY